MFDSRRGHHNKIKRLGVKIHLTSFCMFFLFSNPISNLQRENPYQLRKLSFAFFVFPLLSNAIQLRDGVFLSEELPFLTSIPKSGSHINISCRCEGARELRIFRTTNENVPRHFYALARFLIKIFRGAGCVPKQTQNHAYFSALNDPAREIPEPENLYSILSQLS